MIREENDNNQPAIDIIRTAASGFFCFFLKSLKQETMGLKTGKTSGVGLHLRPAHGFAFAFQGLVHEGEALKFNSSWPDKKIFCSFLNQAWLIGVRIQWI